MSDDLECPYCCEWQEASPDDDQPDTKYQHECVSCGKKFVYTLQYSVDYSTEQAECLNGSEHQWEEKDTFGISKLYRCKVCDERLRLQPGDKL